MRGTVRGAPSLVNVPLEPNMLTWTSVSVTGAADGAVDTESQAVSWRSPAPNEHCRRTAILGFRPATLGVACASSRSSRRRCPREPLHGQEKPQEAKPTGPKPSRVEITPRTVETVAGQQLTFTAAGYDEAGNKMDAQPSAWFAAPFDLAFADDKGTVTFTGSGDVRVGAIINGKSGFIVVTVRPQAVARVTIAKPRAALAVGTGLTLQAHAEMANGDPRTDQQVKWVSLRPDVASIDESGFVVGQAVGTAMLEASVGDVKASTSIDVVRNPVRELSITPKTTRGRTGDVVRFESVASGQANARVSAVVRWSVSGVGATIDADGGFVAERPGPYAVTATIGDRSAVASVTVVPREVARELEVVGRTPQEEFQAAEQWIVGKVRRSQLHHGGTRVGLRHLRSGEAGQSRFRLLRRARHQRRQHDRGWQDRRHHPRGRIQPKERHRLSRPRRSGAPQSALGVHGDRDWRRAQRLRQRSLRVPDRRCDRLVARDRLRRPSQAERGGALANRESARAPGHDPGGRNVHRRTICCTMSRWSTA